MIRSIPIPAIVPGIDCAPESLAADPPKLAQSVLAHARDVLAPGYKQWLVQNRGKKQVGIRYTRRVRRGLGHLAEIVTFVPDLADTITHDWHADKHDEYLLALQWIGQELSRKRRNASSNK